MDQSGNISFGSGKCNKNTEQEKNTTLDKAAFIKVVEYKKFCKVMQKCVEVKCSAWEHEVISHYTVILWELSSLTLTFIYGFHQVKMLNLIITIPSKLKVCHLMLNCSYWYVYALRL